MTANGFLEQLALDLTVAVARLLNGGQLPQGAAAPALTGLTTAHLVASAAVVAGLLLVLSVIRWVVGRVVLKRCGDSPTHPWRWVALVIKGPLTLLMCVYGVYLALAPLLIVGRPTGWVRQTVEKLFDVGLFAVVFWIFILLTKAIEACLTVWARQTKTRIDDILLPYATRSARMLIPAVAVILALPLMDIPSRFDDVVRKGTSILIIVVVGWAFWRAVGIGERITLSYYDLASKDDVRSRKILTQVRILKKVLLFLVAVFTLASTLMLFREVRQLGTSILASAGVMGIILGVAAQRTISNLFAGFQIAITQPIRIGDGVKIENEFGWIEEITLTYVVVKLWDLRRLIVPINQFIEKPFQNWTRTSNAILGSAFLYLDYAVCLDPIRAEFKRIVERSTCWDGKVCLLHVTDASERAPQIRLLVSAATSGANFDLRCEVREKLLAYIREHQPEGLPRTRTFVDSAHGESQFEDKAEAAAFARNTGGAVVPSP